MALLLSNRARFFLANALLWLVIAVIIGFWAFELRQTMQAQKAREEEILSRHQEHQLEVKAEELHDMFEEFYQNARTISLLPAIRSVQGGNRKSAAENVVSQGRLSIDTHRTLEQLYTNLHTYIRISEIYLVLDGFAPERGEVPFFTYDDQIVGVSPARASKRRVGQTGAHPPAAEREDEEYAHFLKQLQWFRERAPEFVFSRRLDAIPALISPLLRTCDNSQFASEFDDPRNVQGILHAMPVYGDKNGRFKGMVVTVLRANQIEARLLGRPFLPLSDAEKAEAAERGWQLPDAPSPFLLTEQLHGIEIADRRNTLLSAGLSVARAKHDGRWAQSRLNLSNDGQWTLHHHLRPAEIDLLVGPVRQAGQLAVLGRFVLLAVLLSLLGWGLWLIRVSRRELTRMAHYDALTELPNRRLFFERLQSALARARRNQHRVGLFYVDVADLNAVNDTFGHHAGDELLVELSARLRHHLRGGDSVYRGGLETLGWAEVLPVVSRLGGDEFTIICEDVKTEDGLVAISERILDAVKVPFKVSGNDIELRLNIGVAVFPNDADESDGGERLLMCADSAMNECKQARTANYVLFNEKTRARVERLHSLSVELQMALSRQQFELYYQPKAALETGQVVSLEGLLRWHHPVFGMVSPTECVPILERSGGIIAVGEWVVEQACRDINRLSEAGYPDIRVAVNVSMRQLRQGHFHETVSRILDRFSIAPDRLILEITESMVMEDIEAGREALHKLKAIGVGLAIDDFGSGYSSLTYLQHLPINCLKLDKGLIDGMVDARSSHVVESVIRLAQGLALKTVAEGIETESQRASVSAMGCDIMQGYLLSEPKPIAELIEWLKARGAPIL